MMKKIALSLSTMLLGGMIYILWRSDTLIMFNWFTHLGIDEMIERMRTISAPFSKQLPSWLIYSAPNALWFFSGIIAFDIIWGKESQMKIFWISLFFILAIGSEIAQAIDMISGTFDFQDLALMLIAGSLATLVIYSFKQKQEKQYESQINN